MHYLSNMHLSLSLSLSLSLTLNIVNNTLQEEKMCKACPLIYMSLDSRKGHLPTKMHKRFGKGLDVTLLGREL